MNLKSIYILILLLCFGNIYCQKYDSIGVKEMEKYLISNPEKAYQLGFKIYNNNDFTDKYRIRLLFSMLNVSNQTQRFSEAIRYGTEGLDLAEDSDNNVSQIKFLGVLGNIYQSLQMNDKAKFYLDKAEVILKRTKMSGTERHIKGNILYLKGMNYAYALDCDMALGYFDQAISAYQSAKDPLSEVNIKLAYLNKAYCLIELNNLEESERYLFLSKVNQSDIDASLGVPEVYTDILNESADFGFAKIQALRNNLDQSNEILFSILELKDEKSISDMDSDIYFQLSQNFLKLREIEKSQYYDVLYRKKMAGKNKVQIEVLNNLLLQNQKNADQRIQQQNSKIVKWSIVLILISAVVTLVLFLIFRKIKRANDFFLKDLYHSDN